MSVEMIEAPVEQAVEQRRVYPVREDRLADARAIVEKVNRKAGRYGLSQYALVISELRMSPVYAKDNRGNRVPGPPVGFEGFYDVELVGEMPRYDGWSFVASLDYSEEGGVITRGVPGVEVDLSAHRARPAECDHCGKNRHRSATYVWQHADGRMMQVGSSCLVPFAGVRPPALDWLDGDPFAELGELEEREERGYGGGSSYQLVAEVLRIAAAIEQVEGWRSKAAADGFGKPSTSSLVQGYFNGLSKAEIAFRAHIEAAADWPAAVEKAGKVQAWAVSQDGNSEWAMNLRQLAGQEHIGSRNMGLLVSAIAGYNKAEGIRVEREQRVAPVFVGEPGSKVKIEFAGEVVFTLRQDGYGYNSPDREMVMIRGEAAGQPVLIKWWASRVQGFEIGAKVTGSAKVKAHETYKDEAQTVVTHAKLEAVPAE